jgi:hypothetical protein
MSKRSATLRLFYWPRFARPSPPYSFLSISFGRGLAERWGALSTLCPSTTRYLFLLNSLPTTHNNDANHLQQPSSPNRTLPAILQT